MYLRVKFPGHPALYLARRPLLPTAHPETQGPCNLPHLQGPLSEGLTANFHFCFCNNPGPRRRAPLSTHSQAPGLDTCLPLPPAEEIQEGPCSVSPTPGTAPRKGRVQVGEVGCGIGGKGRFQWSQMRSSFHASVPQAQLPPARPPACPGFLFCPCSPPVTVSGNEPVPGQLQVLPWQRCS